MRRSCGHQRPRSQGLLAVLHRSAEVFARAGDRLTAQQQRIRALDLCWRLGDHTHTIAALTALLDLYRDWDRPHNALDVLHELSHQRQAAGELDATASALANIGENLLAAGRATAAEPDLSRADQILADAAGHPELSTQEQRVVRP